MFKDDKKNKNNPNSRGGSSTKKNTAVKGNILEQWTTPKKEENTEEKKSSTTTREPWVYTPQTPSAVPAQNPYLHGGYSINPASLNNAINQLAKKKFTYSMGARGANNQYDCSAFVCTIMRSQGIKVSGTSESLYVNAPIKLTAADTFQAGDVVAFDYGPRNHDKGRAIGIDHVGMVTQEDGKLWLVESTSSKNGFKKSLLSEELPRLTTKGVKIYAGRYAFSKRPAGTRWTDVYGNTSMNFVNLDPETNLTLQTIRENQIRLDEKADTEAAQAEYDNKIALRQQIATERNFLAEMIGNLGTTFVERDPNKAAQGDTGGISTFVERAKTPTSVVKVEDGGIPSEGVGLRYNPSLFTNNEQTAPVNFKLPKERNHYNPFYGHTEAELPMGNEQNPNIVSEVGYQTKGGAKFGLFSVAPMHKDEHFKGDAHLKASYPVTDGIELTGGLGLNFGNYNNPKGLGRPFEIGAKIDLEQGGQIPQFEGGGETVSVKMGGKTYTIPRKEVLEGYIQHQQGPTGGKAYLNFFKTGKFPPKSVYNNIVGNLPQKLRKPIHDKRGNMLAHKKYVLSRIDSIPDLAQFNPDTVEAITKLTSLDPNENPAYYAAVTFLESSGGTDKRKNSGTFLGDSQINKSYVKNPEELQNSLLNLIAVYALKKKGYVVGKGEKLNPKAILKRLEKGASKVIPEALRPVDAPEAPESFLEKQYNHLGIGNLEDGFLREIGQLMNGGQVPQFEDGGEDDEPPIEVTMHSSENPNEGNYYVRDFKYTAADLLNINKDRGKCFDVLCLESAWKAYDRVIGQVYPSSQFPSVARIKEGIGLESLKPEMYDALSDKGKARVGEIPYMDPEGNDFTADSWDIHGVIKDAGGSVLYNKSTGEKDFYKMSKEERQAFYKKIPIGAVIGFSETGRTKDESYNKQRGLTDANHSAIVVGYDTRDVPVLYDYRGYVPMDSYLEVNYEGYEEFETNEDGEQELVYKSRVKNKSLHIGTNPALTSPRFGDTYETGTGELEHVYSISVISVPKENAHKNMQWLKEKDLFDNEPRPLQLNIDNMANGVKVGKKGQERVIRPDMDQMKKFTNTLGEYKSQLMNDMNITNSEYDKVAKLLVATAIQETSGGTDWEHVGQKLLGTKFGSTQGLTQLNIDNLFTDELKPLAAKYGITKERDLFDPVKSAIASMIYGNSNLKMARTNYQTGLKPSERVQNSNPRSAVYEDNRVTYQKDVPHPIISNIPVKGEVKYNTEDGRTVNVTNFGILRNREDVTRDLNTAKPRKEFKKSKFLQDNYSSYKEYKDDVWGTYKVSKEKDDNGNWKIIKKTKGNSEYLSEEEQFAYSWQTPYALSSGDAAGNSNYVKQVMQVLDYIDDDSDTEGKTFRWSLNPFENRTPEVE